MRASDFILTDHDHGTIVYCVTANEWVTEKSEIGPTVLDQDCVSIRIKCTWKSNSIFRANVHIDSTVMHKGRNWKNSVVC